MNRRRVSDCVILSLAVFILFIFFGNALRGEDRPEYGETPGYLEALNNEGKSLGSCPLAHTEVKAEITGILSRLTVRQKFYNPFDLPIEAVYTFPLSHDAAVDAMTIHVGERIIRAVIKPREEAQTAYQQAKSNGKLTALLDQERPNIFTQQVANILPGQNVDIIIRYVENLEYSGKRYSFIFPMVVGPRYIPGRPIDRKGDRWSPDTTAVPDASRITPRVTPPGTRAGHDISIEVDIESGIPFTNLRSEQHELAILSKGSDNALEVMEELRLLGFEVISMSADSGIIVGRIAVDKLESLLDIDAVLHIAPHYR